MQHRHVGKVDADVVEREGDGTQQDDSSPWSAQPTVQGDVHVPGATDPAEWRHTDGVRQRRAQSQTETGDDWMVLSR